MVCCRLFFDIFGVLLLIGFVAVSTLVCAEEFSGVGESWDPVVDFAVLLIDEKVTDFSVSEENYAERRLGVSGLLVELGDEN